VCEGVFSGGGGGGRGQAQGPHCLHAPAAHRPRRAGGRCRSLRPMCCACTSSLVGVGLQHVGSKCGAKWGAKGPTSVPHFVRHFVEIMERCRGRGEGAARRPCDSPLAARRRNSDAVPLVTSLGARPGFERPARRTHKLLVHRKAMCTGQPPDISSTTPRLCALSLNTCRSTVEDMWLSFQHMSLPFDICQHILQHMSLAFNICQHICLSFNTCGCSTHVVVVQHMTHVLVHQHMSFDTHTTHTR